MLSKKKIKNGGLEKCSKDYVFLLLHFLLLLYNRLVTPKAPPKCNFVYFNDFVCGNFQK
jgi:hypothetical protein